MASLADLARDLEALLREAGINARVDVAGLANSLPGVLIPPPTVDRSTLDGTPLVTWRLIVLAAQPLGSFASFEQLAELVDAIDGVLAVDRADPISYSLPALGSDPLPAYAVTLSGS